jgi:hypothetical protein
MHAVRAALVLALICSCGFHPSQLADDDSQHDGGMDAPVAPTDTQPATCTSGETICSGRVLETCGVDGTWDPTQNVTCDFTCAAGGCVAPSNIDLPTVATCGSSAPPLDPGPTGTVTYQATPTPMLSCNPACGSASTIAAVETTSTEAWFCVSSINVQMQAKLVVSPTSLPTTALGFIVDGTAVIAGRLAVDGGNAIAGNPQQDDPGGAAGPGGFAGAEQDDDAGKNGNGAGGGGGGTHENCNNSGSWIGAGGGGGGNFEAGGSGGNGGCSTTSAVTGGIAGKIAYSANLVPLVGGGGGGGGGDATGGGGYGWAGGGGGGAVQIAARVSIAIPGEISAQGGNGYGGSTNIDGGGGGGAGGGVLLESPTVTIAGSIVTDGGTGGQSGAGAGGAGATGTSPAQPGASFNDSMQGGAGGGGGGGIVQIRSVGAACAAGISPTTACVLGMLTAAVGFDSLSARP